VGPFRREKGEDLLRNDPWVWSKATRVELKSKGSDHCSFLLLLGLDCSTGPLR